ncbi:hypothetical protein BT63DRAFT_264443 [Microthyrium microscopicum]|uniref:Pre-mRNA-processing factor 39 n=1 Tax=Microthyrium microscopicum TaxID=703497 RepID=A0A6A6UDD2_9PEZI|nr:hypothetical protein BT63DRAFT_264443 [Microthyrium microscopicum]
MADLNGLHDDEYFSLKELNTAVLEDIDNFEVWEKLVRATETLDGGLNRNSSPNTIHATREIYNRFLAKFPLFFGYWKKYADLEFSIAGTESADLIYERGVASISNSVDLWQNYCNFKVETCHDVNVIRELFERGALCVGLDFLSHPFWDKYIEFEERQEETATTNVFRILNRVIHIPMHQYARYFERFRQMSPFQPISELFESEIIDQFRGDVETELGTDSSNPEVDRTMRTRLDNLHLEIFHRTQTETTKRWTYEQEIKRPYFHVEELDEAQLVNWRKYLDFEEVEGVFQRTSFLYERCVVACAYYEEFWLRYARWMYAQPDREEEVRNIYIRASCIYCPISRVSIRLTWAMFEEMTGRVSVANGIHEAMLEAVPGHLETIVSRAHLHRRQGGLDDAIKIFKEVLDDPQCSITTKGRVVAEWARLLWKYKGKPDEARQVFSKNAHWYMGVGGFWISYFKFELAQQPDPKQSDSQYKRLRQIVDDVRKKGQLPPSIVKDITHTYMEYLIEEGPSSIAKEYMELDCEVNGPFSINITHKAKLATDGKPETTHRRMVLENGHPGVEVNEAQLRKGESPYTKYYLQQGEQGPTGSNGQSAAMRFS